MDEKARLREKLFHHFFETKEGILLPKLMKRTEAKREAFEHLHELCTKNLQRFDHWSSIEKIKLIGFGGKKYLFIKIIMMEYLIIDCFEERVLEEKEITNLFTEDFFLENFKEPKVNNWKSMYSFLKYNGNIKELLKYYFEKEQLLSGSNKISVKTKENFAWSVLYINLNTGEMQLSFLTEDQYLYETIFIRSDLTLSAMQDAIFKIGTEKMEEFVNRLQEMKIPYTLIPEDIKELIKEEQIFSLKKKEN